jgi:hypothetical protein
MTDTKRILQVLRDELALQTRHRKLLEAQEQALLACDRERFAALQEEHCAMLAALEAQDDARRAALTDEAGAPLLLSALKEMLPDASLRGLPALEDGLRRTLDRVQALTRSNQKLIQNELNYLAFTLDLFVEAGRTADNGYGGGGRLTGRLLLDRRA